MHLKRLELHGYKSFANRTEFQFHDGVTAIVGPNGSGKSNVADAIQWVLGEQSFSNLRAKKTEDMIFAGSATRVRMGMAEVSMTLDNSTGWLPIEFSEVTVTRRAYRSGENEYLLNGSRTRLRDINELLAKGGLGRGSYVVIGQGLIDSAISLRPEERRTLLEDAAGISLYQTKKSDALSKLTATQENLTRVGDILRELEPRVRRLREQSNRAGQFNDVQRKLAERLQEWYGYQWQQAQDRLVEARAVAARTEAELQTARGGLQDSDAARATLRERIQLEREAVNDWQRQLNAAISAQQEHARRRAVASERTGLLHQQHDELLREIESLASQAAADAQKAAEATAEVERLQATSSEADARLAALRSDAEMREAGRLAVRAADAEAQENALALARQLAELTQRSAGARAQLHVIAENLAAGDQSASALDAEQAALDERLSLLHLQLDSLTLQSSTQSEELTDAQARAAAAERSVAELARELSAANMQAHAAHSELAAAAAQGMGAVLAFALEQGISSVQPIRSLYRVSPEYDLTVRVALGLMADALVVNTWQEAERLAGALPTQRVILVLESFDAGGVTATASLLSHIACASEYRPLFGALLGAVTSGFDNGVHVAPQGWLVQTHALVTVNRAAPNLSALEAADAERRAHVAALEQQLTIARADEVRWTGARDRLTAQSLALQSERAQQQSERETAQRARERLSGEREQLAAARARQLEEHSRLEQQLSEWGVAQSVLQAQRDALAPALAISASGDDEQVFARTLAQQETRAALLAHELQARRQALSQVAERSAAAAVQQRAKQTRADALSAEMSRLESELGQVAARLAALDDDAARIQASLQPAAEQLAGDEASLRTIEASDSAARQRLYAAESAHSQALVDLQRRDDRVVTLRDQIESDYEFVALTTDLPAQLALELSENRILRLPHVTAVADTLEAEVRSLKNKMRWIGNVNLEAPSEYALEKARLEFLQVQSTDLQRASESLQQLVLELDTLMQQRFHETFRAVARAFKEYFTSLFGGGSAELVLTEPENIGATGIDIIAHPPGKRRQPLGLLSGGERSLTAGALVFALLKSSAAPFCVMDEVDAALDEANIGRFRSTLKGAADSKQILIVTHNRGTVEAAGTVYGISMGADGASQMISLRLEGVATGELIPHMKAA